MSINHTKMKKEAPEEFKKILENHEMSFKGNKIVSSNDKELTNKEIFILLNSMGILVETYGTRSPYTLTIKRDQKIILEKKNFNTRELAEEHALDIVFEL